MAQSDSSVTELDLDSIINKLLNHSSGQYITHTYMLILFLHKLCLK